ncbi:hypothetical protein C1Y63_06930 [Corynebacterium sp. 13CS0277]|uniref:chloride channel protein n=1 Tax=Corynebacterium sp. 13CS0277 TaxID=2071994 RepID=UPI000D03F8B3|nr:chloride channel protein [Corynebacterium sp. 13CS0277]PRQ11279.1 hypothetical protein C1Y63_06930 [Corynebacterium sp. 13CS0277]
MTAFRPRLALLGVAYGALAGAIAAAVFVAMHAAQHTLWEHLPQRWMIAPIVFGAGALIAYLDTLLPGAGHRRRGAVLALSAFLAVVAGGAIGPEAGIIAVVGELSALVAARLRDAHERDLIAEIGVDASLGALYGSPVAGVLLGSRRLDGRKVLQLVAATAGLGAFLGVVMLSHTPSLRIRAEITLTWDALPAVVGAALLAAAVGCAYTWADRLAVRPPSARVTLVGSALLAVVFTAWPHLRFAGDQELLQIGTHPEAYAPAALLLGAVAKLGAVILTVRSGWRGGVIFPMLLVATMLGTAVAPVGVTAVAAMGALLTVVTRKPLVVFFVVLFLVPGLAYVPLVIGIAAGALAAPLAAEPTEHH